MNIFLTRLQITRITGWNFMRRRKQTILFLNCIQIFDKIIFKIWWKFMLVSFFLILYFSLPPEPSLWHGWFTLKMTSFSTPTMIQQNQTTKTSSRSVVFNFYISVKNLFLYYASFLNSNTVIFLQSCFVVLISGWVMFW